jgi:cytidine deaminase
MFDVKEPKVTELDLPAQELYDLAREVSTYAYAPYSKFQVGAALRTRQGAVFRGCNVENASFGLTCCAERSAVFAAVAAEGSNMRIQEVAVYINIGTASPCGACRQVIAEFGTDVHILFSAGNRVADTSIAELLPSRFVSPG